MSTETIIALILTFLICALAFAFNNDWPTQKDCENAGGRWVRTAKGVACSFESDR